MIAASLGMIARDLLQDEQEAVVMGVTSRGVFLRLSAGWVIFLSTETHPGPLTLNVDFDHSPPELFRNAQNALITRNAIFFHEGGPSIATAGAGVWSAPARSPHPLSAGRRMETLVSLLKFIIERKRQGGWVALLANLYAAANTGGMDGQSLPPALGRVLPALAAGDVPCAAGSVKAILGSGTGLTPSGDDLTLGLLLALNRWGDLLTPHLDIKGLNQVIVGSGYQKTTLLSANLIECASRGQADQRLITALDAIMTGEPAVAAAGEGLLDWGGSSGCDALIGMALVVMAAQRG